MKTRECFTATGMAKVRFATRSEAKQRAREIPNPMHAYKCRQCGWFHLGHSRRYRQLMAILDQWEAA